MALLSGSRSVQRKPPTWLHGAPAWSFGSGAGSPFGSGAGSPSPPPLLVGRSPLPRMFGSAGLALATSGNGIGEPLSSSSSLATAVLIVVTTKKSKAIRRVNAMAIGRLESRSTMRAKTA
eukprot:TRINITY_DN3029_c0_g2_i1.p3 TRINITY_DN3029_c0_g2~~TRINITY_DN3029_c0_g2_i1.p3  ORF type:complete len:120 (+),score=27.15 TRINITY_DN3029_c0_g2_i1:109-468(+)